MPVTIEFLGLLKQKTARNELTVEAATLHDAFQELVRELPQLDRTVIRDGTLQAGYLASINGGQFTRDGTVALNDGDRILLFPADAGG